MVEPQQQSNGSNRRFNEADYLPGSIKQRHLEANTMIIFTGLDADIPDGTTHTKAYFAFDTNKLYIWNKTTETWKSTTLT